MQKITEENYGSMEYNFSGILISIPKVSMEYDADFYIYGYYIDKENKSIFNIISYNMEDGCSNGFSSKDISFDNIFNFADLDYYYFDDINEFFTWYLQQKADKVQSFFDPLKSIKLSQEALNKIEEIDATPLTEEEKKSIKKFKEKVNKFYGTMQDKEWIHEKCNTNTPPTTVPKHPSKGNKKSSFLDINELNDEIAHCTLRGMIREALKEAIQKDKVKELNKINAESIYWDIYCENETTPEMREKIEEIYPYFKEQYAKSIKQYNGEKLKDIHVENETKEKSKGQRRLHKYYDIINLIGHIVDHKIQRHILEERKEKAMWPKFQEPIVDKIKELDKQYLNWLEEEV